MVIDLLPVTSIDATGLMTITELIAALQARGIGLNAAGRLTEWSNWGAERGFGAKPCANYRHDPRGRASSDPPSTKLADKDYRSDRRDALRQQGSGPWQARHGLVSASIR